MSLIVERRFVPAAGPTTEVGLSHDTGGAYHRGTTVVEPRGGVYHRGTTLAGRGAWGVRPWGAPPYFGTVVAGVTLGTIIAATAYNVAPAPPASNLCWYWTDNSRVRGYWAHCN